MTDYPLQRHYEAFQILIRAFESRDIPYYLIGGQARDLLMSQKAIKPISVTPDIDFAIMIADFGQYDDLRAELIANGFEETELQYRMYWRETDMLIDLLPFGEISSDDMVHFPAPAFSL